MPSGKSDNKVEHGKRVSSNEENEEHGENYTRKSYRDILIDFAENTTAHGYGHIRRTSNSFVRSICIIALCATQVYLLYVVTNSFIRYQQYPVRQTTSIRQQATTFPDVTLCNLQGPSPSAFGKLMANTTSMLFKYMEHVQTIDSDIHSEALSYLMSSPGISSNIPLREINQISHEWNNFIVFCKFAGNDCKEDSFAPFYNMNFNRCFTFKPGRINATATSAIGARYGLQLILYLESTGSSEGAYNTYSPIQNAEGALVIIHEAGILPQPTREGVDLMPGYSTSVGLEVEKITRLPKPYDECTDRSSMAGSIRYSQGICYVNCEQNHVYQKCGCVIIDTIENIALKPQCGLLNYDNFTVTAVNFVCMENVDSAFNSDHDMMSVCNCPQRCSTTVHKETTSASAWPATLTMKSFVKDYILSRHNTTFPMYQELKDAYDADTLDINVIRQNFLRLNVFLKSADVVERIDSPGYDWNSMLADIGGQLGLFAGISLLTIGELFHYLGVVIWTVWWNRSVK